MGSAPPDSSLRSAASKAALRPRRSSACRIGRRALTSLMSQLRELDINIPSRESPARRRGATAGSAPSQPIRGLFSAPRRISTNTSNLQNTRPTAGSRHTPSAAARSTLRGSLLLLALKKNRHHLVNGSRRTPPSIGPIARGCRGCRWAELSVKTALATCEWGSTCGFAIQRSRVAPDQGDQSLGRSARKRATLSSGMHSLFEASVAS